MLDVLDITESFKENRQKNSDSLSEPFCSAATLKALTLKINSAMALTEEMLQNDYHTVLPGNRNHPIEVK